MGQGTGERQRIAMGAVSAVLLATLALVAFTSCTSTGQPITAAPHFTLAYRGTDGLLHVRWSPDGQTWNDPTSFPPAPALASGPGLGGIPTLHYGPGDVRLAHGPREQVEIAELIRTTRSLAVLAARCCGAHR